MGCTLLHAAPRTAPRPLPRRKRGAQRPRPPAVAGRRPPVRVSDLILAMLSLTLLGALGLMAGAALLGRALGH